MRVRNSISLSTDCTQERLDGFSDVGAVAFQCLHLNFVTIAANAYKQIGFIGSDFVRETNDDIRLRKPIPKHRSLYIRLSNIKQVNDMSKPTHCIQQQLYVILAGVCCEDTGTRQRIYNISPVCVQFSFVCTAFFLLLDCRRTDLF